MTRSMNALGKAERERATQSTKAVSRAKAPRYLMKMLMDAMAAKCVYAAAELGLADLLQERSLTSAEMAELTGAHGPSLRRLLLALDGIGIIKQKEPDLFELTDFGQPLRKDSIDSVCGTMQMMCGSEVWRSWDELVRSIRTGEAAWDLAHGMTWSELYELNPEVCATFNLAMAEQTRDTVPGILAAANLSRFRTVVDVGGGDGTLIASVLRACPDVKGVVFDMPRGLQAAAAALESAGVERRCRVVSGDFFISVPVGADAYLLKHILHDWDDEQATAILRNVRAAVVPGGRVFIVERTLPEQGEPPDGIGVQALILDIHMLVATGGQERTQREYYRLLSASGFEPTHAELTPPFGFQVIEATAI
jgi:hypothetical protein